MLNDNCSVYNGCRNNVQPFPIFYFSEAEFQLCNHGDWHEYFLDAPVFFSSWFAQKYKWEKEKTNNVAKSDKMVTCREVVMHTHT